MKKLLITAGLLFATLGASAQFHADLRAGATASAIGDQHLKMGIRAGAGIEYLFTERWGLRSGLFFSMKGATTAASIPASHTTDPVTPTHAHDQQQPVAPSIPVRTQPSANTPMTTTNPAARQVPDFALRKGGPASMPIDDETSEHDIVSSGDLGDLDIPDFLR